jgi:hypothetical protein
MRAIYNLAAAAILPAIFLGGCQTTVSVPTSPIVNVGVGLLPENIRQHVVNVCGWLEPAQNIVAIVESLGGYAVPDIANQVAAEICDAVQPRVVAGRRYAATRIVNGIRLRGRFV